MSEVTCYAPEFDPLGMAIDFGLVKQVVGGWLDDHWDHRMILNGSDPMLFIGLKAEDRRTLFGPADPYLLPKGVNPTAENLAQILGGTAGDLLQPHGVFCVHVKLWETPNCWADWHSPRFAGTPVGADPSDPIPPFGP